MLSNPDESHAQQEDEDDIDVPEETETVLQDLFKSLQDKVDPIIVLTGFSPKDAIYFYRIPSFATLQRKPYPV